MGVSIVASLSSGIGIDRVLALLVWSCRACGGSVTSGIQTWLVSASKSLIEVVGLHSDPFSF